MSNQASDIKHQVSGIRHQASTINRVTAALLVIVLAHAVVLGIWHTWRFAEHNAAGVVYRGTLDGQEGTLLHEARLILRGEPLYQPLELYRVVGAPYPPVHAYLLAAAEWLVNPTGATVPADGRAIFAPGRIISLSAMLAVAVFAALIVLRLGRNPVVAAIAGLLLLAPAPVQLWASRVKPDPLALALTAGGLFAVTLALTSSRPRMPRVPLVVAALLFAAAFFTKQTYIAAPLAVGVSLFLGAAQASDQPLKVRQFLESRTPLFIFSAVYAGVVGVCWLLADLLTAGQFTFHVWGLHPPEWWIYGRFLRYFGLLAPAWPLALLAGAAATMLLVTMFRHRRLPPAQHLLPLAYCALGVATIVGSGTIGSHHNHLLEPSFALTIGGAFGTAQFLKGSSVTNARVVGLLAAGLLLTQGWSYVNRPEWYGGEFDLERQDWERFVPMIASQPGEVLSDDVGFLLLAGKDPRYDDPPTMGPAARSNLWDQSGLLDDVANRRFDVILLHFDATEETIDAYGRWSPEFIATLREHYDLLYRDIYFSYVPKP